MDIGSLDNGKTLGDRLGPPAEPEGDALVFLLHGGDVRVQVAGHVEFLREDTFSISEKNIPDAKEKIKQFKREIAELSEGEACTDVYQLNLQLFPLTNKPDEGSHEA